MFDINISSGGKDILLPKFSRENYILGDWRWYLLVHIHCSHIANQMLYNGCCKTRSEKLSSRALLAYHVIKPNHAKPLMLITSNMAIGQVPCNSNIRWRSKITSHQPWCKSSFFSYIVSFCMFPFSTFSHLWLFLRGESTRLLHPWYWQRRDFSRGFCPLITFLSNQPK